MATWGGISENGTGESTDILERPQAVAMLFENTTAQGQWVMASNMTANYYRFNRIVNNVTMAMPHAGVSYAAGNPINNIMQPDVLDGVGGYLIKASAPSPAVNVLCVNMNTTELAPLVYTQWRHAITSNSSDCDEPGYIPGQSMPISNWTGYVPAPGSDGTWLNSTVVDDIFQWGETYTRYPPVFPMVRIHSRNSCPSAYFVLVSNGLQHHLE
jgi:hypothetical protein